MSPIVVDTSPVVVSGQTFLGLLTEFYAHGFDYLNDGGADTLRAKRWINYARAEINDLENWPYLETVATGTAPLVVSDLRNVEAVVTPSMTLDEIDRRAIRTVGISSLTTTGPAQNYYVTGVTTVNTYPVGADPVTVYYFRNEPDLVNDADVPLIPARFTDLIVIGAVRRALLDDADGPDYQSVDVEWQRGVEQMRKTLLSTPGQQLITDTADW